jgi:hypothetical protein
MKGNIDRGINSGGRHGGSNLVDLVTRGTTKPSKCLVWW